MKHGRNTGDTREKYRRNKEKQLNKYTELLLRFTHDNRKGQKYLIGGIEKTVESFEAALLPKVSLIFKELYDEDVLEEEVLLEE